MANLKKDLNLIDEAIKYYKKSLSINSNILVTNFNLAIIYQSLGEFEKSKYKKTGSKSNRWR